MVVMASRKFVKCQQGKKTLLSTSRERTPFCSPAEKEGIVAHQQGKKTMLMFSLSLVWPCVDTLNM